MIFRLHEAVSELLIPIKFFLQACVSKFILCYRKDHKYQHHRNQPRAQVIFEYTNQNPLELIQTVRNFINFMKTHPSREQFKTNKIFPHNFNNKVNESEIHESSLEQVQKLINEDTDLVFDALVAADYIDKIKCTDGSSQKNA